MKKLILVLALVFCVSGVAQATLIDMGTDSLGNKLIYDKDYDITWYDFTYYSAGWDDAVDWANNLIVDLGDGVTIDDWRLPTAYNPDGSVSDFGYNVTGSEMGHLYYTELGNLGFKAPNGTYPQPGWDLKETGPFENLELGAGYGYWTGEDNAPAQGQWAIVDVWFFYPLYGKHDGSHKWDEYQALAVYSGKIEISAGDPVPEPSTMVLLGLGLAGVAAWRSKRRRLW